jgi:hypothetical protein
MDFLTQVADERDARRCHVVPMSMTDACECCPIGTILKELTRPEPAVIRLSWEIETTGHQASLAKRLGQGAI